ncbi:hypothetical protein CCP3SC15_1130007 [Gammaproteobacteria bacterium]
MADEAARLSHRLFLSLRDKGPVSSQRFMEGFNNWFTSNSGSDPQWSSAAIVLTYLRCWGDPKTCDIDLLPVRRTTASPNLLVENKMISKTMSGTTLGSSRPAAYWADYAQVHKGKNNVWPSHLLSVADVAELRYWVSGAQWRVLKEENLPEFFLHLATDKGLAPLWSSLAWWIEHQSDWNPLAIDYDTRRRGLLMLRCCHEDCDDDAAQGLDELTAAQFSSLHNMYERSRSDLSSVEEMVRFWAQVYAGEERVVLARQKALDHARTVGNRKVEAFLDRYWYLYLDDTDLVLRLLRFHRWLEG